MYVNLINLQQHQILQEMWWITNLYKKKYLGISVWVYNGHFYSRKHIQGDSEQACKN